MNQEWLERLVIASPIDISLVSIMHNLFANEFTIKAFALGGNFVLLTFKDKDIKEAFLSNGAPWLRRRFYDFQPCEEKLFHSKRTIRVRLYGTPLFLWSPHLFKWLGMKLGNFVSLDYSTSSKSRINYARIQITTESLDLLNKIVAVEVGDWRYHISAFEETDVPVSLFNNGNAISSSCSFEEDDKSSSSPCESISSVHESSQDKCFESGCEEHD